MMKTLNFPPKFIIYMVIRAVRHPRAPISHFYCPKCKVRFPASASKCPKCGDEVSSSPDHKQESPVPWYGSVILIVAGAAIWGCSAAFHVPEVAELGRVLVYIPLGNLFGMSLQR
ncbi:hypothetical protein ES703_37505 [subsurface metagenome]